MDNTAADGPSKKTPSFALPPMAGWLQPEQDEDDFEDHEVEAVKPPPRSRQFLKMALVALIALLVGAGAGSLLTRQRYKARQVVASINGEILYEPDFLHRLEIANGDAMMRQIVAEDLQLQYARKMNVYPSNADVVAKYKKLSEQPTFGQYLTSTHQASEDVMHSIRLSLAQAALVNQGSTISDDEVKAYYGRQTSPTNLQARFYTPQSVTIAVITSKNQGRIRQAAQDIARGGSFAQAAVKYSEDPSRANGGTLSPVLYGRTPSSRIAGVEQQIFALQTGQQIGPQQIAGAWWLIRCLDKKPAVTKPFEEVKGEAREGALLEKSLPARANQVRQNYMEYMKAANVRAFWPQYSSVINTR